MSTGLSITQKEIEVIKRKKDKNKKEEKKDDKLENEEE